MFPIDAADALYSNNEMRSLIGKRIVLVKLLKREAGNALLAQTPREAGLVLEFENGVELILSHGLHDNSDDFAVIFRANILPSISKELQEILLLG